MIEQKQIWHGSLPMRYDDKPMFYYTVAFTTEFSTDKDLRRCTTNEEIDDFVQEQLGIADDSLYMEWINIYSNTNKGISGDQIYPV